MACEPYFLVTIFWRMEAMYRSAGCCSPSLVSYLISSIEYNIDLWMDHHRMSEVESVQIGQAQKGKAMGWPC